MKAETSLRQRISLMRWVLSLVWVFGVVIYQLVIANWIHHKFSEGWHFFVEIIFYGIAGPLLALIFLAMIDERLTESERYEKRARTIERRLASITHISADAILSLDSDGRMTSWNPGAEDLFGFQEDEIKGQPLAALIGGGSAAETEVEWIFDIVRRRNSLRGHETVCYNAAGEAIHVEMTVIPLSDQDSAFIGLFIILRDISSRKRREEEINRLNKSLNQQVTDRTRELNQKIDELASANAALQKLDQTRTEFVSLVSHQLKAPLTNMSGAVENIRISCNTQTSSCARMLAILDQQAERMDRLVDGVLSTARVEAGELIYHKEPVSIQPLVKQIVNQFRARQVDRNVQLRRKPGLPLAFTDRDRLAEILANLLDNASKFGAEGTDIFIDLRADQEEITISVRDFGPGVPPEDSERVFEKFYRTDSSDSQAAYGYGLGLYICSQLVHDLGGRIWEENHPEGGAVFSFTIPVWQEEA